METDKKTQIQTHKHGQREKGHIDTRTDRQKTQRQREEKETQTEAQKDTLVYYPIVYYLSVSLNPKRPYYVPFPYIFW